MFACNTSGSGAKTLKLQFQRSRGEPEGSYPSLLAQPVSPAQSPNLWGWDRGRGKEGFPRKAQNSQPFPEADQLHTLAAIEGYVFLSSFY